MLTCVTGVSGSGKSTLVHDVLYAALKRAKGDWDRRVGTHRKLEGAEFITDVVLVDQAPIGRTPRSNPVTYLKAFDPIRELFAATKDARVARADGEPLLVQRAGRPLRGVRGRRAKCKVEMQFLADVFVPCEVMRGQALQAAGARSEVPRARRRPGARHDRPRGADVLQHVTEGAAPSAGARRDRSWLPAPGPAGDDAVRRRGAANQDRRAPVVPRPAIASSTSSTSRRPASTSTTSRNCWRRSGSCCRRATACWSSSTTST